MHLVGSMLYALQLHFRCVGLVVLAGFAGAASSALSAQTTAPQKHLEITGNERLRITYDSSFVWPEGSGYSAVMDLPVPPETGGQQHREFYLVAQGADGNGRRGPPPPDRHAAPRQQRPAPVHWEVAITGVFQTRQLVDGPPASTAKPIVGPGPGAFLASTESINWKDGDFQDWLDSSGLRRTATESPVAFGERVYDYFKSHGRYVYPPVSPWTSAACCQRLRTDCGGYSLVFTAACRANRIPARLLVGQWFKARRDSDGTVELRDGRQAHVIAEFFDPQIGWIPEDISSTFLHTPGYTDLNFFGRDPAFSLPGIPTPISTSTRRVSPTRMSNGSRIRISGSARMRTTRTIPFRITGCGEVVTSAPEF